MWPSWGAQGGVGGVTDGVREGGKASEVSLGGAPEVEATVKALRVLSSQGFSDMEETLEIPRKVSR